MTLALAERIRIWRTSRGKSQAALGREIGVSPEAVCQWESGKTKPVQSNIEKLVEVLELTMEQFYGPPPELSKGTTSAKDDAA
jgi:transcriptional regulator with XRE-family HTH domain